MFHQHAFLGGGGGREINQVEKANRSKFPLYRYSSISFEKFGNPVSDVTDPLHHAVE